MRTQKIKGYASGIVWLLLLSLGTGTIVQADTDDADAINFAFQHALGDGFFFGSRENVEVFKIPVKHTVRRPEEKGWGLELKFPLTVGLYNLEVDDEDIDADLMAIVPGVELEFPVLDNWTVKPYADFGVGKDVHGGDLRYIFGIGLKSYISWSWRTPDFTIGNALRHTGYFTRNDGPDDSFSSFDTGLDIRFPLGIMVRGKESYLSCYGVNYHFFEEVVVVDSDKIPIRVDTQWEVGTTFGTDPSWKLWFFELSRVGLGYRFGDGLHAIREAKDGPKYLFISFDIDVVDPAFVPGTGTPEPGGLTMREANMILRRLAAESNVVGFELVELNPLVDPTYVSALNANRLIREALTGMAMRKLGLVEKHYLSPLTRDDGRK